MQDLFVRRQNLEAACTEDLNEMRHYARLVRDSDAEYRRTLATRTAELRAEGMSVSIIDNIAKGDEEVASARTERDFNIAMYDIAREAHLFHRMLLKNTQADLEREWRG